MAEGAPKAPDHGGTGLRVLARLSRLAAVSVLAALLWSGPGAAAERLVFQSRASRTAPWLLEFMDPAGGGALTFATSQVSLIDPTWSHDDKTVSFYEQFRRGLLLKPAAGGSETSFLGVDAVRPSWSPVAGEIAYWEPTADPGDWAYNLKVATIDGLTKRTVAGPYDPRFAMPLVGLEQPAWSPDGKTIAFPLGRGISKVPAAGGAVTALVSGGAPRTFIAHEPSFAPDRKQFAYIKSFDDQNGSFTAWQVVVRNLESGQEFVIADGGNSGLTTSEGALGPQSWSPDSTQIAYADQHVDASTSPSTYDGNAYVVRSDGTRRRSVAQRAYVGPPSWGGSGSPNYYIKHIEVAQAISPIFGPLAPKLPPVDPKNPDPYDLTWQIPELSGFPVPLIAGRTTLLRVYVGDASMESGKMASVTLHYRATVGTTTEEKDFTVDVTAEDREPVQTDPAAAINIWVPGSALSAPTATAEIEVNAGEREAECVECYPHGNKATMRGIAFEQGGDVTLAPVPILLIDGTGNILQPSPLYASALPAAGEYLPLRDGGVGVARSPLSVVATVKELDAAEATGYHGACALLWTRVNVLRAVSTGPATDRWVGISSPPHYLGCNGISNTPGRTIILNVPNEGSLAHELGHSVGLDHTLSLAGSPEGATPLPYVGIGGVGYQAPPAATIHEPLSTSDLMGYDAKPRWTSPATWWRMHQGLVGQVGIPRADGASASASAMRPEASQRVLRLVGGYLTGDGGAIFSSLTAKAAAPDAQGPVAAEIVALDRGRRVIAKAKVKGTPLDEGSGTVLPFVVALPPTADAAALQLRRPGGAALATLRRSRHAPSARFVGLPQRARARARLTVRWKATDRDGKRLTVMLLARRGRAWKTIMMGPAAFKARVNPAALGRGRRLRLRLVASDGFNTTATTRALALKK
jgi:WD40 repeat protein